MASSVLILRAARDAHNSVRVRQKVEADLERVKKVAEEIRRMTRLYQERLDGNRGKQS